jgi:predicted TIM-barrel fold metal-dependent hydrolase
MSGGRLISYAVATPWLGAEALEELRRARDAGARALKLDSALQGFDLLDGQAEPLIAFAIESGWPVYIRTGTPPHALPLQVAWLAGRFPECSFLLGKAGATDFSHDGPATLAAAPNVYADSVYVEWPTALAAADPQGRGGRVFFSTDAPFGDPAIELARVSEAPYGDEVRDAILGGTLSRLLGL